jgi:threonine/homoserine/homoserine lactone efflux protein
MEEELDTQEDKIIENLERLNTAVARQNSIWQTFLRGLIYGVGFFIGSAFLATLVVGIFGPLILQIPWVHTVLQRGASLEK